MTAIPCPEHDVPMQPASRPYRTRLSDGSVVELPSVEGYLCPEGGEFVVLDEVLDREIARSATHVRRR